MKTYYKASLSYINSGIQIYFQEFLVIHETKFFVYCVDSYNGFVFNLQLKENQTLLQKVKEIKRIKIKRINKKNSRFAFDNKSKAFDNLKYKKRWHARHLRATLAVIESFNKNAKNLKFEDLAPDFVIPETFNAVNDNFNLNI